METVKKLPKDAWRWTNIVLRTGHLCVACLACGALIFGASGAEIAVWLGWTMLSGSALCGLEIAHDGRWPHRGKGLLGLGHVALSCVLGWLQGPVWLVFVVIVLGCVGSHMPRAYRHWSVLYGPEQRDADDPCVD